MEYPHKLATLLDDIEAEMRRLELWEDQQPPAAAFRSPNPFCFDTMAVTQWLQWVFIPQMRKTLAMNVPLAAACQVAPAAALYLDDVGVSPGELVLLLEEFDALMPDPATC